MVCPTASSQWHVTAYVLAAGASHTSDKLPADCNNLIAGAQAVDAVGGLLELLQYMDVQLRQVYVLSAADQMLRVIGAQPVDLNRLRIFQQQSSSHQSTGGTGRSQQSELRIIIEDGSDVPASN